MSKTYIRKPLPVEAVQWTGHNEQEVKDFCGNALFEYHKDGSVVIISSPFGKWTALPEEYIIKEKGILYVSSKEVFEKTYEEVYQDL